MLYLWWGHLGQGLICCSNGYIGRMPLAPIAVPDYELPGGGGGQYLPCPWCWQHTLRHCVHPRHDPVKIRHFYVPLMSLLCHMISTKCALLQLERYFQIFVWYQYSLSLIYSLKLIFTEQYFYPVLSSIKIYLPKWLKKLFSIKAS